MDGEEERVSSRLHLHVLRSQGHSDRIIPVAFLLLLWLWSWCFR